MWAILQEGEIGETCLIGAEGERGNIEILQMILAEFGLPGDAFDKVADRPGHDRRYAVDASKLMRALGWRPVHTDFEAGLREAIAWYRDNTEWWKRRRRRPSSATLGCAIAQHASQTAGQQQRAFQRSTKGLLNHDSADPSHNQ